MDYLALLRNFDEPEAYAFPLAFDEDHLRELVDSAHQRLQQRLGPYVALDCTPQDASFYGDALLSESPQPPRVRFSHFGWMATILGGETLPTAHEQVVRETLIEFGFLFIPESELHAPYDGVLPESAGIATWKTRFFDYL